jgi:hypothetical protein
MTRVVLGRTEIAIHPLIFGSLPLRPLQAGLTPGGGGAAPVRLAWALFAGESPGVLRRSLPGVYYSGGLIEGIRVLC